MTKHHAPKKLELQFYGEMNEAMKQMTVDYKEAITTLGVQVKGNEDLLLQPSYIFKSLENLSLNCETEVCDYDSMVSVCEAILYRHANSLTTLKLEWLKENINLRVPTLPILESLTLNGIHIETAWPVLEKFRPTITSLVLIYCIESSPNINGASNNSAVYHIPNLKDLTMEFYNRFQFVQFNAQHLVSLDLSHIEDIPNNIVWPEFPKLRELKIDNHELIPILINSRETLERLVLLRMNFSNVILPNVLMPRLTDLYLDDVDEAFSSMICNLNHRSLEFLYFRINDLPYLDAGTRMERMRNVVLRQMTSQDIERMTVICPKAEVVLLRPNNMDEIRDMIKGRCKRRNFTLSVWQELAKNLKVLNQ